MSYRYNYTDKNGALIHEGDLIRFSGSDKVEKVYLTDQNTLGTDATNPKWIEKGKAVPCQYGIYPLNGKFHFNDVIVDCELVEGRR